MATASAHEVHLPSPRTGPTLERRMKMRLASDNPRALDLDRQWSMASRSFLVVVVLALAWFLGFSSRLFSVIRFESIIHEFDPWFNYRATRQLVSGGFYNFINWFDDSAWYPLGRIVGGTVYPGLMVTSGFIHYILNSLNITIHIRDVCVFLAPVFSGLTAIATFLLTREVWNEGAGLLAACFIAIVPGYVSRSVAGSYDNEGIAIFALMFTYFLWIKSIKTGSVFWSSCTAVAYFYMVSAWGGYVFIINLIPLHVFVLLLMGRFSPRIYVAYTTFFILGLLLSMQIPFVGFQPVRTSEHMAAHGIFVLIQLYSALLFVRDHIPWDAFKQLFVMFVGVAAVVVFLGVVLLTYLGYVAPWSGRFYSLYDTGYAKIHIPIIASVSEHQPTTWSSFFLDLHILIVAFPAGVWFCFQHLTDELVFVILYAVSAVYFAGVMVRLMLTLTPIVCVVAAITFSQTFNVYFAPEEQDEETSKKESEERSLSLPEETDPRAQFINKARRKHLPEKPKTSRRSEQEEEEANRPGGLESYRSIVVGVLIGFLAFFALHSIWVTGSFYSSPSVVLEQWGSDGRTILDDFREGYFWLRQNTHPQARVMSWWDYGYQIAGFANRTTLVDNNTWNNSHIALVGKAMSSNESAAYEIMRQLDVDYVLVIFGGMIGYGGDDINKFLWMVRIAEGEHPKEIQESNYFTPGGEYRVDSSASKTMLNCLMYKLSYYRFGSVQTDPKVPRGFDRTRRVEIGRKDFKLRRLEEAFTSEHWLVRIYKVKEPHNRDKSTMVMRNTRNETRTNRPVKTQSRPRGHIKDKLKIVRGQKKSSARI